MHTNKKEIYRLIIPIVCGLIHFLIALKLRPALTVNSNNIYSFLLGTIPSFLTVFGLYFLVSFFTKKKPLAILFGIYLGSLIQELQQANYSVSESSIVGRTFDYYDIAFLTLGAIIAYLVEHRNKRMWINTFSIPVSIKNELGILQIPTRRVYLHNIWRSSGWWVKFCYLLAGKRPASYNEKITYHLALNFYFFYSCSHRNATVNPQKSPLLHTTSLGTTKLLLQAIIAYIHFHEWIYKPTHEL